MDFSLYNNGSFEKSMNDKINKCSRGTWIQTYLSNGGAHSVDLATELFHRQILLILNYGCLIWMSYSYIDDCNTNKNTNVKEQSPIKI